MTKKPRMTKRKPKMTKKPKMHWYPFGFIGLLGFFGFLYTRPRSPSFRSSIPRSTITGACCRMPRASPVW